MGRGKGKRSPPRAPKLGRSRIGSREPAHVIKVYCEGLTEKRYLDAVARAARRTGVHVEIVGRQGVPRTVAQVAVDEIRRLRRHARRARGLAEQFEVWAVCDRDEHPGFEAAAEQCGAHRIGFAWSNPCVELWAVLHFDDQTAHIERHRCQRALSALMPGYDHETSPTFVVEQMTSEARRVARKRALRLQRRARDAQCPRGNPSTALWKLVDVLLCGDSTAARARAAEQGDGSAEWWLDVDPGT